MQGGMYNVLEVLWKQAKSLEDMRFTSQQISEITGLCKEAVSNNLNRLVKVGLLEKEESWIPHTQGNGVTKPRGASRQVYYKIRGDMYAFIDRNLFG